MKNYLFHVGIDISKLKLDVVIIPKNNLAGNEHFIVDNNKKGIKNILDRLKKKVDLKDILFCCENTGIYTNHLTDYLTRERLHCWVVPAIEIKKSKGISRGKNDKTDARDIAWYSIRNFDKLKLYEVRGREIQQLKLLHTEREKLLKAIGSLKRSQENKEYIDKEIYKPIASINAKTIKLLKASLKEINKKIKEIIESREVLKKQSQLIKSVKGIGEQTATYFIIATNGFTAFENWRKLACYSGIAPFENSSGSSLKGKTKVSNLADKKMKTLLQMCAITAIQYDPQLKEYYNRKIAEGKNPMLVLNNVRCKLMSRVFAVVKRQTPFVNIHQFAA